MKLAVPSVGKGGLDAQRSAHFGHADCFTILNIEDGKVSVEGTIANPPHEEGGCMRPVRILAEVGIDAIVAVGMGMRPMQGFAAAGITVLHDAESATVDVYKRQLEDMLEVAFAKYCAQVPWANDYELSPKSVLRDMLETGCDFKSYIAQYKICLLYTS